MGLKSAGTKSGHCVLRCRSATQGVCRSIRIFKHRPLELFDGQLGVFIIFSPKCTKITIFLQITLKPENILKGLQKNYTVSKNIYIPWLKLGKTHGISTSTYLLFCLSPCKTTSSLSGSGLKTIETHTI